MRRSKAPSLANKAVFKSPIVRTTQIIDGICLKSPLQREEGLTSESSYLSKINEKENNFSPNDTKSSSRQFIVVYGKRSTKKHKTWEGDGTLEVGEKSASLKDENGKVIGQITNLKNVDFAEGTRLVIGSKEVEIIESVEPETNIKKRPLDSNEGNGLITNNAKKKKEFSPIVPSLLEPKFFKKKSILHSHFEELVMPRPTDEHQWVYNTDCLPVTPVSVPANLCRVLRPHQREGVTFLYKCISGIRNVDYNGAILADEMGLGKTLQCISLIWTLLNTGPYGGKPLLKRVLIVVPSSLTQNWNNEFIRWIGSHKIKTFVVDKKNRPCDYLEKLSIPIFIISYEMFMRGYDDIKNIEFDLIVCDEGHRLKNCTIKTSAALNILLCKRRILLTGTPIQNDLQEFFALVDLVNHGVLGNQLEFRRKYIDAIIASRDPNASEEVVKNGEEKSEELGRLTKPFILRRTQSVIDKFLPHKNDFVVFCEPTDLQKRLYSTATNYWFELLEEKKNSHESPEHLTIIHSLKKICNHPILIRNMQGGNNIEENISTRLTSFLSNNHLSSVLTDDSVKLRIVSEMLKSIYHRKERVVLVSNFTQTLDLFEDLCNRDKYKYLRFDGSTPTAARNDIVNRFNGTNSDVFVLLLSSKAGGVGLNLIGASRLVLYDSDWNPATDLQAMARIWREGQKKPVYIYRLLTSGTIEEKIFQRQLSKAGLSESVVDPSATSNVKLSLEEIKDLFNFTGLDKCITHKSLQCDCDGDGSIPAAFSPEETVEDREADLMPENSSSLPSLRMNQLFQWEHHEKPVSHHVLEEMGLLNAADDINYVFKNKTCT